MKILFTGGGTGGHFYPIIAVAEEINIIAEKEHLLKPKFFYMAPIPYDKNLLIENDIKFIQAPAGKIRRYFSLLNIFDFFKTFTGIFKAIWSIFFIFPDVVFSKGGYASFPALFAARILGVPVVIHESDSIPGRTSLWSAKFAKRIAISYDEAIKYFPKEKTALTGNPIRKEMRIPQKNGAHEFLKLKKTMPVIVILGGSSGAQRINNIILEALPHLVDKYQIIHQTGKKNIKEVKQTASVILNGNPNAENYKPFPYLNSLAMKMVAGIADIIITRAGSALFEIALWGVPSIVIPIPEEISRDQLKNAFTYMHTGAGLVIEEGNLAPNVLVSNIDRLMQNEKERDSMRKAAKNFAKPDAAEKIAKEIIHIGLKHEK